MIKILLLAVVPFITQHRNVVPKTEVSTNFYGSVTGIVDKAYIEARVGAGGGGCDTNTIDALANSAVVTNALTVATTNRVAAHVANTDNPHAVTAAQVGAVGIGDNIEIAKSTEDGLRFFTYYSAYGVDLNNSNYGNTYHTGGYSTYRPYIQGINGHYSDYTIQIGGSPNPSIGEDGGVFIFDNYDMTRYGHHAIEQWRQDGSLETLIYFPIGQQGTIALRDWQSLSAMLDSTNATTIAENPTFSNAVLAVGLNIDTNSVAVLNDIAKTFGGFPLGAGETATTVGGLLAALAAAAAWLKKNKVGSFASVGGATATVENGVAKLDGFFINSNSLLTGTIDEEIIEKGTAPDAHLEAPTDERLKLVLADSSVAYDSAKALPYKLTSVIGDRVIATMTLTAASTDITLPTIAANDTTVKDFILDVTNTYAVEGVATDAGINIPRTDFKLVTRDGESLTDVTTVKAGKSAFLCFTQKAPVVVGGTTYPCWCVIQLPFGDPS